MDKKRPSKPLPEDLKGFEEFVEGQTPTSFLPRPAVTGTKKETSFEHFTFLTTDGERLQRLKLLLTEKLPFASQHEQGTALIREQRDEIKVLQKKIFDLSDEKGSAYRRSLEEVFNSFFDPTKP